MTEESKPAEQILEEALNEKKDYISATQIPGGIPVIKVEGTGLAETWENSVLALRKYGYEIPTEYDEKLDGVTVDQPSLDSTLIMTVTDPMSEPFIHRGFPGGLEDLEEYMQEVCDGIKNHWVRDPNDPTDDRWEYTYNQRLFEYKVPGLSEEIDQIAGMVEKLAKSPFTRRAQAITWQPWFDSDCYDPACLQSIWGRVSQDKDGTNYLNINVRFRSRDAYDAAFMNCFALISLQERLASQLSEMMQKEIKVGRYVDLSDSYHIYGRRRQHFDENFLKMVGARDFEDRTWDREFAKDFFEEAKPMIIKKIKDVDEGRAERTKL